MCTLVGFGPTYWKCWPLIQISILPLSTNSVYMTYFHTTLRVKGTILRWPLVTLSMYEKSADHPKVTWYIMRFKKNMVYKNTQGGGRVSTFSPWSITLNQRHWHWINVNATSYIIVVGWCHRSVVNEVLYIIIPPRNAWKSHLVLSILHLLSNQFLPLKDIGQFGNTRFKKNVNHWILEKYISRNICILKIIYVFTSDLW